MRKRSISTAFALSFAALSALSCSWPGLTHEPATGSLGVVLNDQYAASGRARTIAPTDTVVISYDLTASGPNGKTAGFAGAPTTGYTLTNLAPGTWTIHAVGKNAAGDEVTEGDSEPVTVSAGATAPCTIDMIPISGLATCEVQVSWPDLSLTCVGYQLYDAADNELEWIDPEPTVGTVGTTTTFSGSRESGMFRFKIGFSDGQRTIWIREALQLFGGLESLLSVTLTADDFTSPPAAPSGLTALASNQTALLHWTNNSNTEENFILERKVDSGSWALLDDEIPAGDTSYTDSAVSASSIYYYRISSTNAIGDSSPSDEYCFDPVNVTAVTLGADFFLHDGGIAGLVADVDSDEPPDEPFDPSLTWESSDEGVALVDATGQVTANGVGTATITVTTTDGSFTDICVVTVTPYPEITAFGFMMADNPDQRLSADSDGLVVGTNITVTVPFGTYLTALTASFAATLIDGQGDSSIWVGTTAQTSGLVPNDFSSDVTYRVTAADGFSVNYLVHVIHGPAGGSGVTIDPNPHLAISFGNLPSTWEDGSGDVVVTATVTGGTPDSYQWYLDGVKQVGATASTFTIGSGLGLTRRTHRLALYVKKNGYVFSHEESFTVAKPVSRAIPGGSIDGSRRLALLPLVTPPLFDPSPPGRFMGREGGRHA